MLFAFHRLLQSRPGDVKINIFILSKMNSRVKPFMELTMIKESLELCLRLSNSGMIEKQQHHGTSKVK